MEKQKNGNLSGASEVDFIAAVWSSTESGLPVLEGVRRMESHP